MHLSSRPVAAGCYVAVQSSKVPAMTSKLKHIQTDYYGSGVLCTSRTVCYCSVGVRWHVRVTCTCI